jgi:hypothetical protein
MSREEFLGKISKLAEEYEREHEDTFGIQIEILGSNFDEDFYYEFNWNGEKFVGERKEK